MHCTMTTMNRMMFTMTDRVETPPTEASLIEPEFNAQYTCCTMNCEAIVIM